MKNGENPPARSGVKRRPAPEGELFRDHVFETVIAHLEDRFDSHDFIFEMMRRFPREYTSSLYECRRSKDPIQTLHAKIGRKLLEFSDLIRKAKRGSSRKVRGLPSENQHWEKIDTPKR
jgi:HEPN domain-containing protein